MADSGLLVTTSGAALSLLFYENVRSQGDQMGFLLGETVEFIVRKFTDSDNQVETVKIHINVDTVVTCPTADLLQDSTGRINREKLKDFVRDKSKQVIGWFRFRRGANLIPTLRDKILHKEFSSYFANINSTREDFFLMCLLNSNVTNAKGTHKFKNVFLRHKRGSFEPIPLRINNLGDDASRHDGSDYKAAPAMKSSHESDVFSKLIQSLNLDLARTPAVESVTTIQRAAEQYLNTLIPKVCESDREVAELERQVQELRSKISAHKAMKKLKLNGSPDNASINHEAGKGNQSDDGRAKERMDQSPPRIGDNLKISEDIRFKDRPTSSARAETVHKTRSTADPIAKSIATEKPRRSTAGMDYQSSPSQDPFPNAVSDVKMDTTDSYSRTRRSIAAFPEIAKQPICRDEHSETGVGRGRGSLQDFAPGMRKARRVTITSSARNSPKNSIGHPSNQESDLNNVQTSVQSRAQKLTYSQTTRKNANSGNMDVTDGR